MVALGAGHTPRRFALDVGFALNPPWRHRHQQIFSPNPFFSFSIGNYLTQSVVMEIKGINSAVTIKKR